MSSLAVPSAPPGAPPDWAADWVAASARAHPDRVAIESGDRRMTYAALEARVASTAAALAALGVERGEPVAVLAGNTVEFAIFAHAIPRSGAAFMPLNARLTSDELDWQLRHSRARTLIVDAEHADAAHAAAARRATGEAGAAVIGIADARWSAAGGASEGVQEQIVPRYDPRSVHSVVYTSGTSGRPKGALLTWGNFRASAFGSALRLGVDRGDRWLACMPLFHVGGLSILLRSAIYGTAAVLHQGFDAAAVNHALRHGGITMLSVVATMLRRMLDAGREPYPRSLRAMLVGGGPVPPELLDEASARGLPVQQTYGLTEAASQVTTLSAVEARRRRGAAGRPLFQTSVRIAAEGAPGRSVAAGEVGEILVAGPTLSPGYLHDAAATAAAFEDGWLRTGDLGHVDRDGFLFVADRRDDLIVTGGENVYPAEVEAALLAHPAVEECAVAGIPDAEWGAAVVAAVVLAAGHEAQPARMERELRDHVAAVLAGYKVPRRIELSAEPLPRTASGKLLRRVVRERLASGGD